ncbi:hypothetical protein [Acaryochloris marina]|uniref:hypothetical protein n=1 Tax=Acaryochloris marina TaxID=155978 RepID=UPI002017F046|nr:hypothetical protein [Acaryochloris marina]
MTFIQTVVGLDRGVFIEVDALTTFLGCSSLSKQELDYCRNYCYILGLPTRLAFVFKGFQPFNPTLLILPKGFG